MTPIEKIQKWMNEKNYDIFIINRTDEFLNEYIAGYAERLKWISNFSGSAGRAIIEQKKAYIFIDGRYTNQVKQEVDKKYFEIKHLQDYWMNLKCYKTMNMRIIIDPWLHSVKEIEKIENFFINSKITIKYLEKNPIDMKWNDQPSYPNSKAFLHDNKYAGEDAHNKIKRIQKILISSDTDYYLLSSLDSIAWLLNLRGNDIEFTPLIFCYVIIPSKGKIELFIDQSKIKHLIDDLSNYINFHNVRDLDKYLLSLNIKKIIRIDEDVTAFHFKNIFRNKGVKITHLENPCLYPKAIKNYIELNGARKANIRDGVSINKFLYWLKNITNIKEINEICAAEHLLNLRRKNDFFYSLSFDTISALGPHAALPHYRVNAISNTYFANNSIYLVDSGAQYKDGTTDITRTIIIGTPTNEQKDRFTRVLKGHIAIATTIFPKNTRGSDLDPLARKSLQEINCDYDHGTGHGIGSFLSVHEGPQRIAKSQDQSDSFIHEGMILSNEPGYYKKNEYGIRCENLIICRSMKDGSLFFETISWAPFDKDLIDISILDNKEIEWINNYHSTVFEKINYNLKENERER